MGFCLIFNPQQHINSVIVSHNGTKGISYFLQGLCLYSCSLFTVGNSNRRRIYLPKPFRFYYLLSVIHIIIKSVCKHLFIFHKIFCQHVYSAHCFPLLPQCILCIYYTINTNRFQQAKLCLYPVKPAIQILCETVRHTAYIIRRKKQPKIKPFVFGLIFRIKFINMLIIFGNERINLKADVI